MWSTGQASRWEMNVRSTDGSGRAWKLTYSVGHSYGPSSYTMIERLF